MKIIYSWILDYLPTLRLEEIEQFLQFNGCEISEVSSVKLDVQYPNKNAFVQKSDDYIIKYTPPYDRCDLMCVLGLVDGLSCFFDLAHKQTYIREEQKNSSTDIKDTTHISPKIQLNLDRDLKLKLSFFNIFQVELNGDYRVDPVIKRRIELLYDGIQYQDEMPYITRYITALTGQPITLYRINQNIDNLIFTTWSKNKSVCNLDVAKKRKQIPDDFPIVLADKKQIICMPGKEEYCIYPHKLKTDQDALYLLEYSDYDPQSILRYYSVNSSAPTEHSLKFIQNTGACYRNIAIEITVSLFNRFNIGKMASIHQYSKHSEEKIIEYSLQEINDTLGYRCMQEDVELYLKKINCYIEKRYTDQIIVVPKYRQDLNNLQDIAEELESFYTTFNPEKKIISKSNNSKQDNSVDCSLSTTQICVQDKNAIIQYTALSVTNYLLYTGFSEVKSYSILENNNNECTAKSDVVDKIIIKNNGMTLRGRLIVENIQQFHRVKCKLFESGKFFYRRNGVVEEKFGISCIIPRDVCKETLWQISNSYTNANIYTVITLFNTLLQLVNIKPSYSLREEIDNNSDIKNIRTTTIFKHIDEGERIPVGEIYEDEQAVLLYIDVETISNFVPTQFKWKEQILGLLAENQKIGSYKDWALNTRSRDRDSYIDLNVFIENYRCYSGVLNDIRSLLSRKFDNFTDIYLRDIYRSYKNNKRLKLTMRIVFDLTKQEKTGAIEKKIVDLIGETGIALK